MYFSDSVNCISQVQKVHSPQYWEKVQSGASSLAKHGGAYFSAVYGSIQDPIAILGTKRGTYHRSAGVKTTGKKSEKIITTKQNLKTIHIFGETLDFLTIVFGFLRFSLMHYPIIAPLRGSQGLSARRA